MLDKEFFTEFGEASQYDIQEVVGKGSYGIVASAIDTHTGERVAIKKMNNIFEHVSDATRILREIKLLRLLRHPDIVEIKHIMLPASRREFKDIYVVFELMESDLHQVIKLNNDLTPDHHQFFLYQLLRSLKYIHSAHVFHRDLKPKNILANADCKLKLCDFGLARVSFSNAPSAIFWTDYVATRWYRAPELCGSFSSKVGLWKLVKFNSWLTIMIRYTPAIDIWSIGCIFAELVTGKPLFPGKNVVHQLELITDLLGTPPPESVARVCHLLRSNMLCQALADPYFDGLANLENEPSRQPISKLEFEFERRRLTRDGVRELIYREILEYHPEMLNEYLQGIDQTHFMYPSGVDWCKEQFASLEDDSGESDRNSPVHRKHATSLPRERVCAIDDHDDPKKGCDCSHDEDAKPNSNSATRAATVQTQSPPREQQAADESTPSAKGNVTVSKQMSSSGNSITPTCSIGRSLLKSDSMCASRCIGVVGSDRQVHAR
ncbi:Mitogen-activated protein kinase 9 [Linum perenne]